MKYINLLIVIVSIFSILLTLLVSAHVPATWYGYVEIDGVTAIDGTIVEAFVNSETTAVATETLDRGDGYYIINVPAKVNDNITLKVNGVACNEGAQTWTFELHELNLTMNKSADGTTGCTYDAGCSGGHCVNPGITTGVCSSNTYYCDNDGTCESAYGETSSTCPNDCGNGGGGGGGGGGAATTTTTTVPTTTTTIPIEESSTQSISENETGTFSYIKDVGITDLLVNVKNSVSDAKITIKTIDADKDTCEGILATISAPGISYRELCLEKENIENEDISTVTIKFKVSKTWISENNIDPDTIALYRYSDSSWTKLTTTKTSEDSNYIYFEAESPGLSAFVISGETLSTTTTTTIPTTTTTIPSKPISKTTWYVLGIIIIILVLVYKFVLRR